MQQSVVGVSAVQLPMVQRLKIIVAQNVACEQ